MKLPLFVTLLVLAALPLAVAQSHEHGPGEGAPVVVLHDGPDDGRAVVGGFTHFGFALLGPMGAPVAHQDAEVTLVQNGRVLFQSASTHEYDGLFSLDVTFQEPGPYEMTVTSGALGSATFRGEAVMPANETVARLVLEPGPGGVEVGAFVAKVVGPDGALLPHTDVLLELRVEKTGRLLQRVHGHIHETPIAVTFHTLEDADGPLVLHGVAYNAFPTGRRADFTAVVAAMPVPSGVTVVPPLAAVVAPTTEDPLAPVGPSTSEGTLTLHGTFDPQRTVALGQPMRLSGLVVDANGTPVPHVDFALAVTGPRGVVFESATLHEYDGVLEWVYSPPLPGAYEAALTAFRGDVELSLPLKFTVAPPLLPLAPGAHMVELTLDEEPRAGEAAPLRFRIADAAGNPLSHAELDVTVYREGEAPAWLFKLHSHGEGTMAADVAFPAEGAWRVRVDPAVLLPQASVVVGPFEFEVDVGPGLPVVPLEGASLAAADRNPVPSPGAALVAVALLGVAACARRLRC